MGSEKDSLELARMLVGAPHGPARAIRTPTAVAAMEAPASAPSTRATRTDADREPKTVAAGWSLESPDGRAFLRVVREIVVGGDPGCTLPITEPGIEPKLAKLTVESGALVIEPLALSGIHVNDAPLRHRRYLHHGDKVRFGSVRFKAIAAEPRETIVESIPPPDVPVAESAHLPRVATVEFPAPAATREEPSQRIADGNAAVVALANALADAVAEEVENAITGRSAVVECELSQPSELAREALAPSDHPQRVELTPSAFRFEVLDEAQRAGAPSEGSPLDPIESPRPLPRPRRRRHPVLVAALFVVAVALAGNFGQVVPSLTIPADSGEVLRPAPVESAEGATSANGAEESAPLEAPPVAPMPVEPTPVAAEPGPGVPATEAHSGESVPGHDVMRHEIDRLMTDADALRAAGRLIARGEVSAASLYRDVLAIAPDHAGARERLDRIVLQVSDEVIASIREVRFDDARRRLSDLRLPGLPADSLTATSVRRLEAATLLLEADTLIQDGAIDSPPTRNAMATLRRVLALEPGNDVAQDMLAKCEGLLLHASRRSARGDGPAVQ